MADSPEAAADRLLGGGAAVRGADATTDSSVVGKSGAAAAAGDTLAPGVAAGALLSFPASVAGSAFILASVSCCVLYLLLQRLHGLGQRLDLLAQGFDLVRRGRRRRLLRKERCLRTERRSHKK